MRCLLRRKKEKARAQERTKASKDALADATNNLQRMKKRSHEVSEVSQALRVIRERNHFREQLETIMGGQ